MTGSNPTSPKGKQKLTLYYFPIRGRAEPIRLILAYFVTDYDTVHITTDDLKNDLEHFPFGQVPRLMDGHLNIVQTKVILRYLAEKFHFTPARLEDKLTAEMVVEGCDDMYNKYVALVYEKQLAPEAVTEYWSRHGDRASVGHALGAHLEFLARILRSNVTGTGWVAGPAPCWADLCLFNLTDLHVRLLGQEALEAAYPELVAHHKAVSLLPPLRAYLASPARPGKVNGNGLG